MRRTGRATPRMLLLLALLLIGCTTHTRYVWRCTSAPPGTSPDCTAFDLASAACMNQGYVPNLFGGGAAIWKTLYKDCMEKRGYEKLQTVTVPDDTTVNADESCRARHRYALTTGERITAACAWP